MPFAENENEIKSRVGFVYGGADYYPTKKISLITSVTRSFYKNWDDEAYKKYIKMFKITKKIYSTIAVLYKIDKKCKM